MSDDKPKSGERPGDPCTIVIFGATGDLTRRKLLPALYNLRRYGLLPKDFAIVEECFQYDECDSFKPFVEAGKAVFEAEYELAPEKFCDEAKALGFSAIRKGLELFAKPWEPCEPLPAG